MPATATDIFKRRLKALWHDEKGVALVMTVGIYLLLFIVCAGVHAVGETARQKIELQNACDSAAYAAAVVQADGLSRMAMVNRAMSWTYVRLTNVQMDYITFRWMRKARNTFREDRKDCEEFNKQVWIPNPLPNGKGSFFTPFFCYWDCQNWYLGENRGWFCGVSSLLGGRSGNIKMNGDIRPFSSLDQAVNQIEQSGAEQSWREMILQMKTAIEAYNAMLQMINIAMQNSIQAVASATLVANLPRIASSDSSAIDTSFSGGDASSGIDLAAARDMLWYVDSRYPMNPYASDDDALKDENGEVQVGGYFSPLYNTELGERLFLGMADGEVYNTLEEYFGPKGKNGGLDQWFIRGPAADSAMDAKKLPSTKDATINRYMAPGICRVYKNANRPEGGSVLRGHHTGIFFLDDTRPSCLNDRRAFPEQCAAVENNEALYAEYEWSALRFITVCWMRGRSWARWPYHTQYGFVKNDCPHLCCHGFSGVGAKSHSRSQYDECYRDDTLYAAMQAIVAYRRKWTSHPRVDTSRILSYPCGMARIYGDDREIYDKETYCGAVAQPWVLNASFYGRDGAITVGLARKMRNPFAALLGFSSDESANESGIYSMFDPVKKGYIVAFSAARAAHHFHPSAMQLAVAPSLEAEWNSPAVQREYETRYDSVCHDSYSPDVTKFNLNPGRSELLGFHVGCVCNDGQNLQRFARNWNLCETDWDATLLPLAYSRSPEAGWYDSMSGGETRWYNPVMYPEMADHPFINAAGGKGWQHFCGSDGKLAMNDDSGGVDKDGVDGESGDFLAMPAPGGMGSGTFSVQGGLLQRVL